MKIVTILGARPQFIKAAIVSKHLRVQHTEILVHTGQHYDYEMSQVFFKDLGLPHPDYNLEVGSGSQAYQTGHALLRLEPVLIEEKPDLVLLYGDTNATLSGALAAAKLHIPIAHIEAGIRHYDRVAPEEVNRLLTDHLSSLLFCPTQNSAKTLKKEGISSGVHFVGDVLLDLMLFNKPVAKEKSTVLQAYDLLPEHFYLATVHRPINTDNRERLITIFEALEALDSPVILPLHPRTRHCLEEYGLLNRYEAFSNLILTQPLGYLDFLMLEQNAKLIITDSGSVQREAYFLGIPCVTLHTRQPWPETVSDGWNVLMDPDKELMLDTIQNFNKPSVVGKAFGNGIASKKICEIITEKEWVVR